MNDNQLYSTIWICVAAILITVAICVYKFNVETNKFLFENGYSQVQLIGSNGTMWVKTDGKGKFVNVDGKAIENTK